MPPALYELCHLLVRWLHLIAGIMWIGNSMLFNWLDRNLEPPGADKPRSLGTIWMVHSGGFYSVEKTHLAPGQLPATLHWFKWQNGITWMSGIALLVLVYYMGGAALMTEPGGLSAGYAVALGIATVVASWIAYDVIWRSPLGKSPRLAIALCVLEVVLLAAVQFRFLGGRAAYIHVGVMLGTIMTGNVWFVILPSQRELIAATKEGRAQDPRIGYQAKQRSVHNNYITFPLLFIMLSNHFPIAYGNKWNWLVLLVLAVGSALVRHFMNIRFHYAPWPVNVTLVLLVACGVVLFLFAYPRGWAAERASARANVKVDYRDIEPVLHERCVPCHSSRPTSTVFHTAPNGVLLETHDEVEALLPRVKLRAVTLQNMPLGNATQMTDDERSLLASYIAQEESRAAEMSERSYFRSHRVLANGALAPASIHVKDGRVERVSGYDDVPVGAPVHSTEHVILPGVVDSHVHVNQPGRTEWEGFESATRAAAAGGITTIVNMPLNSIPATTTESSLAQKTEVLDGLCRVDVGLWGGAVPANTSGDPDGLGRLLRRGALGFKCFLLPSGVDEFPYVNERDLRAAMTQLRGTNATLMVHAELEGPILAAASEMERELPPPDPRAYATYLRSRPPAAEDAAVKLVFELCKATGTRAHIVHLSSAGALETLARARDLGLPLTAETAPHYLYFSAASVPDGATWFKCAPPIRDDRNRDQLWKALEDGLVSMVVSDHSPCTPVLKHTDTGDFMAAWGGIAGLQFSFSAVWTEAAKRGVPLATVARWMTEAPARHAGLFGKKGAIQAGFDADLVFFDPDRTATVKAPFIHHRHKLSPYEGETLRGVAVETYLRDVRVSAADAEVPETRTGKWIPRA